LILPVEEMLAQKKNYKKITSASELIFNCLRTLNLYELLYSLLGLAGAISVLATV
jgi:hypothetical protein